MTQRIFDVENEKDMQDLWDILPDWASLIKRADKSYNYDSMFSKGAAFARDCCILKINWHDKTEITRPIQEATEQDIGKLCYFWSVDNPNDKAYGILSSIGTENGEKYYIIDDACFYEHCRRLTKQEIEELNK